ncbi:spermidine family transporter [Schizosaccharomyces osmophilus]|uniref:Spermidine family transporter n=1 Tax=Schizosaccharomyces osmophilus TaxID=2545709 RepID=A0AAE9WAA2_9SCHI|nr:spermidine family transporter [Schizosaccharomyces osmophilus]XP_056038500.1 spermidine family transporter [Schizosaccharomyces osmophilus]WBW72253.1 spermidine family transporter [Schizosaccharomyces osmophilus]WBW74257.1 spermidine family transporter [Schizosaccharomyces osmophilus]
MEGHQEQFPEGLTILEKETSSIMGEELQYPKSYPDVIFLVDIDKNDPQRPMNWSTVKKIVHTALYGLTTFAAQFNSTTMSPTAEHLANVYHIGEEVATLATSLYVLGIAFGPMIFAPFSEMNGRKMGVFLPFFISIILTTGTASADSVAAIMCTRFFSGLFSGAPIVSSGGVLADLWNPSQRGSALVFYAFFVVSGADFGPIISSLLSEGSDTAWRWPLWFIVIVQSAILLVSIIMIDETYVPVIEARQARNLRLTTGNWGLHAAHERYKLDAKEFVTFHLLRPFAMLATPVAFFIALFASYVYGILYLVLTTIPYTYYQSRNWQGTVGTLPLIAMFLGLVTGGVLNIFWNKRYAKYLTKNGGKPLPEERLPLMMMTGWLMPAGIFVFAWTSYANIHWIVSFIGIFLIGVGFETIFQGCLNYLVDTFTKFAASAIAANTFTRSIFAATFPLFSRIMFQKLGIHWGGTLVGFIALGMIPIPFVFYRFGESLRRKNPYVKLVS